MGPLSPLTKKPKENADGDDHADNSTRYDGFVRSVAHTVPWIIRVRRFGLCGGWCIGDFF